MNTSKPSLASQRRGQIGVNAVERVVLKDWHSRWQSLDAQNDDGVDGLIFLERGGAATGQVVYVQVKCRTVRVDSKDRYCITGSPARLAKNLERWKRLVGAAILVHVDPKSLKMRWVNLRDPNASKGSQIFIPAAQILDRGSKADVSRLCGQIHRDLLARPISLSATDFPHVTTKESLQASARRFYVSLRDDPVRLADNGPLVFFGREGWRHITRRGRGRLTRHQSLILLGAARRMIESTTEEELRTDSIKREPGKEVFSLRAAISFPFRQTGIVKIMVKPDHRPGERRYAFHTIYEPRRKRDVLGARQLLS